MFLLVKVLRARQIGTRQNDVAAAAGRRHFRVQRKSTIFLLLSFRRTHLSGATFTAASRLLHCLHTLGVLNAQGGRDALSQRVPLHHLHSGGRLCTVRQRERSTAGRDNILRLFCRAGLGLLPRLLFLSQTATPLRLSLVYAVRND